MQHTQFHQSVSTRRDMGVQMLYGEGGFVPNELGKGRPPVHGTLLSKLRHA
ncbi:hypothetical protein ACFYRC_02215 [Streptomyces sp. NPDC005279]|uniref:hypothetical protein n=1 Tax=Streptomyces sp. NPDC005279 TaxID=3364712 RepID=UPI00369260E4